MNKKYKIAVIGFGSIGKRHLTNIVGCLNGRGDQYTIDLIRRENSKDIHESMAQFVTKIYHSIEHAPNDYDIAFITNPTNKHYETIQRFSKKTKHMFIEKPVFDGLPQDLDPLALSETGIYYVACPLRYTAVAQYLKEAIDWDKVYSVRAICSSYLPDWRKDQDYRKSYSAHKNQGGGVAIDLIHEWDYLIDMLGLPEEIACFSGKYSSLEMDSEDIAVYIAKFGTKLVEVHLDYFGREAIREVTLFSKEDTVVADFIRSEIRFLYKDESITFGEDRNAYQLREIESFFDMVEGVKENNNPVDKAIQTLKIAELGRIE